MRLARGMLRVLQLLLATLQKQFIPIPFLPDSLGLHAALPDPIDDLPVHGRLKAFTGLGFVIVVTEVEGTNTRCDAVANVADAQASTP